MTVIEDGSEGYISPAWREYFDRQAETLRRRRRPWWWWLAVGTLAALAFFWGALIYCTVQGYRPESLLSRIAG